MAKTKTSDILKDILKDNNFWTYPSLKPRTTPVKNNPFTRAIKGMRKPEILVMGTRQHSGLLKEYQDVIKQDIAAGVGLSVKELFEENRGDNNSRVLPHLVYENSEGHISFAREPTFRTENNGSNWQPINPPLGVIEFDPSLELDTSFDDNINDFFKRKKEEDDKLLNLSNEYFHGCYKCGKKLFLNNLRDHTKLSIKKLIKMWESPYIEFYCCTCFEKQDKKEKKDTRLIAKAKRISAKFGYILR